MKLDVMKLSRRFLLLSGVVYIASSCSYERSGVTGWNYNDPKNGGFEKAPFEEQETGPGLVLIEGGHFTQGRVEQDVTYDWNNVPRGVTVSSFYMDETEISNFHWLEYLNWTARIYSVDYPEIYKKALPDTLVWRQKLAFNEPYVELYLRHPAYRDYPVVGVNWLQANDFSAWRTDRVNEMILIREGLFYHNPNQVNEPFSTDSYLAGQYDLEKRVDGVNDYSPDREFRNIRMEDGVLLPRYRLPTEAEWEFAAYALIGNSTEEWIQQRRIYPWNGHFVRRGPETKEMGEIMANFVRGKGDYMGVAGKLNDNADVTAPVYSYWPNDYGLYNMAGNVSEWVMDVYRPISNEDVDEFRPFRGNVYKTKVLNSEGTIEDKYDLVVYDVEGVRGYLGEFQKTKQGRFGAGEADFISEIIVMADEAVQMEKDKKLDEAYQQIQDVVDKIKEQEFDFCPTVLKGISNYVDSTPGNLRWREVEIEENIDRRNYRESDNIDFLDGDIKSSIYYDLPSYEGQAMYQAARQGTVDPVTLINNRARVFKGASWRDRAYWMNPGTRRFLDERQSTSTIGFRCAMVRVGSPVGLGGR
jgi:formylglycine-generating enzyme required for sulfatase activity